jgi:hypothetical protein
MEKIITIQYNSKTYSPSEVSKQTSLVNNNIAYSPSLTEKIISEYGNFLTSNVNSYLLSNKGYKLVYGK